MRIMTIQKLFFCCFGKSITKPVLQSCNASLYGKLEKGSFFFLILQIIHIAKYRSNYTIKLHWHRPVSYYSIPGLTGSTLNWMYFWHFLELLSYICILDLYMKWNVLIWKDTRKLVCSTFLYWILFFESHTDTDLIISIIGHYS
jgi:hypothetical protein